VGKYNFLFVVIN